VRVKTFPTIYNTKGVAVANDSDTALELIADELSAQDYKAYLVEALSGQYDCLLDALDGFGYKIKHKGE